MLVKHVQTDFAKPSRRSRAQTLRGLLAGVATVALVASGVFLTTPATAQAAGNSAGSVSGTVFRDFNSNGVLNTGKAAASGIANDVGLAGVTVTAFDRDGDQVGTATSKANGTYTLAVADAASNDLRVEFGSAGSFAPAFAGADNGTSVQFVTLSAGAATGVDYAVNAPSDYSTATTPAIVTTLQAAGVPNSTASTNNTFDAFNVVVANPWTAQISTSGGQNDGDQPNRNTLATFSEVGSVGTAVVDQERNQVVVASTYKRLSGLKNTVDTVYLIPTAADGTNIKRAGTITSFNLNGLAIEGSADTLNVGVALTNSARGLGEPSEERRDADAFARAATIGVGGMTLSSDGDSLYFVNLLDKNLYSIDISGLPGTAPTVAKRVQLGLGVGERASAVSVHHGDVYVGVVTTGETADGVFAPGIAAQAAGLVYTVKRTAEKTLTTAPAWTNVSTGSLGYTKGNVLAAWGTGTPATANPQILRWNTWTGVWSWGQGASAGQVGMTASSPMWAGNLHAYPQPILSGIAFDTDGFMQLAFTDRTNLQSGNRNLAATGTGQSQFETVASGDLLIAGPNAARTTFTLENNGTVTGYPYGATTAVSRTGAATTANQGPGGREFYADSQDLGTRGSSTNHYENTLGSVVTIPGVAQVLSTSYDPLARARVTGLNWFNTGTGAASSGYVQSCSSNSCYNQENASYTFQKGGGIGTVAVLAEQAPLQIGNRVWFDADQDGLQDADEPGIDGVTVQLLGADGTTVVDTITTANGGEYYFSVDPGTQYTVKFVLPESGTWSGGSSFGNVPWADLDFTTQHAGAHTAIDSNPDPATGKAPVTTGAAGENDHSIDAGLVANVPFSIAKALASGSGAASPEQAFTAVVEVKDFRGNAVTLSPSEFALYLNGTAADAQTGDIFVPVGSLVKVTEKNASQYEDVVVSGPSGVTAVDGFYPLLAGAAGAFGFTITNTLPNPGTLTVSKQLSGDFELTDAAFASTVFTVAYAIGGEPAGTLTLNQANSWTATIDPIPAGSVVTLSETTKSGAFGYDWDAPSWSAGGQDNGTAVVTVGDNADVEIVLTNTPVQQLGGFSLSKFVSNEAAWAALPDTFVFPAEYSVDGGATWVAAGLSKANNEFSLTGLPVGSAVLLREGALEEHPSPEFSWSGNSFSGTSVVAGPEESGVWIFTVQNLADPIAITLENTVNLVTGNFAVTKQVTGAGLNFFDEETEFTLNYRYQDATAAWVTGSLELLNGVASTSPAIRAGTKVYVAEVQPSEGLSAGSWGTPKLSIAGEPLASDAEGEYLVIGESTTVALELENPTTVTPTVEILKGDGVAESGTITNEADTVAEGEAYAPGETREIVIRVTNSGPEPLRNVVLTDDTLAGAAITSLVWTFPGGASTPAAFDAATGKWTASWVATHGDEGAQWAVGDVIVGTATLTLGADAGAPAHQDRATVNADGVFSGTPVTDTNEYNAFTSAIQVIKYDGNLADPAVQDSDASWVTPDKPLVSAAQDANDEDHAVLYPVGEAQSVRWVVTNTGGTWLTNLSLADVTDAGPAIGDDWTADLSAFGGPADYSFTNDGAWGGLLPPGASFFAEGSLTIDAVDVLHTNTVTVIGTPVVPATGDDGKPTDEPSLDEDDSPITVKDGEGNDVTLTDNDPFNAKTLAPAVNITKGDGAKGVVAHEADSMVDGEAYVPGETREIVFTVENTGNEPLIDVDLSDVTVSGGQVTAITWTLPDGETTLSASAGSTPGTWTANWAGPWLPGEIITGTASLTVLTADAPHVDRVTVDAVGQATGVPVRDENDYNAFTGSIQIIKYDGNKQDPAVKDSEGNWTIPTKPLEDASQDANDTDTAVEYPVSTSNAVRWVVTNTGTTWLTDLTLEDVTGNGPDVQDWTCDLSEFGGEEAYDFAEAWSGGLFAPGASFFCEGDLTLAAEEIHQDEVTVVGTVVVPATDEGGMPTGDPLLTELGDPVRAQIADANNPSEKVPFVVTDDDPFNAWTGVGPYVDIEKYDTNGTPESQDADTMSDVQYYEPGETRTIEFSVTNTGDEALREVVLTDNTLSGGVMESLKWTLPGDAGTRSATLDESTGIWSFEWDETFGEGGATWLPGETITGTATLTVTLSDQPHVNRSTVTAVGAGSGIPVTDVDDYNALTAGIQVIKYDGNLADPKVKDSEGNWILPQKPLVSAAQDANSNLTAVQYETGKANSVRWVVTNTGTTWLTELDLADVTGKGPDVTGWTADLSAFGGPAKYDFVANGTWHGLLPPGASFFAEGTLTLDSGTWHNDTVTVEATPVVPAVDDEGVPTGEPEIGPEGPVLVTVDGKPVRVTDSDPFNAHTGLSVTGAIALTGAIGLGVLLFGAGGIMLLLARRKRELVRVFAQE